MAVIPTNKDIAAVRYNGTSIPLVGGFPIEVSTAAGMASVLIEANVGKAYKFTGATDANYTNGDIYVVEESA